MIHVQVTEDVVRANQESAAQKDVKVAITTLARERGIKVAFRGLVTRVTLADGTTGKAKCDPTDTYSALLGYQYAVSRAQARSAAKLAIVAKRHVRR